MAGFEVIPEGSSLEKVHVEECDLF
jgi:hypothetical protein